jgi:hypothetical protein
MANLVGPVDSQKIYNNYMNYSTFGFTTNHLTNDKYTRPGLFTYPYFRNYEAQNRHQIGDTATFEGPIAYISTGGGGSTTVGTGSKLPRFSYNRPKAAEYVHVGGFFQNANPRSRSHFIIHPDWVSETFST